MSRLWLVLALWGTVHPMYYFLSYMRAEDVGLTGLSQAWYVNASTTGLTWDLIIAALSLTSALAGIVFVGVKHVNRAASVFLAAVLVSVLCIFAGLVASRHCLFAGDSCSNWRLGAGGVCWPLRSEAVQRHVRTQLFGVLNRPLARWRSRELPLSPMG